MPNKKFYIPYNKPDKIPPNDLINGLFAKASTDSIHQLKKAVVEGRVLLASKNEDDRTILTYVLNNTNLTSTDKFEIFKSCCTFGAPLDIPDKNGIRPLHTAAMQQNRQIVEYLLQMKADPNGADSQYMTPLHHAMQPNPRTCTTRSTLIDQLLPPTNVILKNRLVELSKAVYHYIADTSTDIKKMASRMLAHLNHIFANPILFELEEKGYVDQLNDSLRGLIRTHLQINSTTLKNKSSDLMLNLQKQISQSIQKKVGSKDLDIIVYPDQTGRNLDPDPDEGSYKIEDNVLPVYATMMDTYKCLDEMDSEKDKIYQEIRKDMKVFDDLLRQNADGTLRANTLSSKLQAITMDIDMLSTYYTSLGPKDRPSYYDELEALTTSDHKIEDLIDSDLRVEERTVTGATTLADFHVQMLISIDSKLATLPIDKKTIYVHDGFVGLSQVHYHLLELAIGLVLFDQNSGIRKYINFFEKYDDSKLMSDLCQDIFNRDDEYKDHDLFNKDGKQMYDYCIIQYDDNVGDLRYFMYNYRKNEMVFEVIETDDDNAEIELLYNGDYHYYNKMEFKLKGTVDEIKSYVDKLYKAIINLMKNLNKAVDMRNRINANRYIEAFANFAETDETKKLELKITGEYSPSYFRPFKILPSDLKSFKSQIMRYIDASMINDHSKDTAKYDLIQYMYDNYVYRLKGDELYYSGNTVGASTTGTAGYFISLPAHPKTITEWGEIGKIVGVYERDDKYNAMPPNLVVLLDRHMRSLKYGFIKEVMIEMHEDMKKFQPMIDLVAEVKTLNDEWGGHTYAYHLIAQTIERIFNDTVLNLIETASSQHIDKMVTAMHGGGMVMRGGGKEYVLSDAFIFDDQSINKIIADAISISLTPPPNTLMNFIADPLELYDQQPTNDLIERPLVVGENEKLCISVDPGIISLLIGYGADVKSRAVGGITPLKLALYLQNIDIVRQLIGSGAPIDQSTFDHMKQLLFHSINSSPLLTVRQITETAIQRVKDKTRGETLPKNSLHIIPMAMYLLDHNITAYANRYPNMWDYTTHRKILDIAGIRQSTVLPLADKMNSPEDDERRVYRGTIDSLQQEMIQKRDQLVTLNNSKNNFKEERKDPSIDTARAAEIDQRLAENKTEKNEITAKITELIATYTAIETKISTPTSTGSAPYTPPTKECIAIYDDFFTKIPPISTPANSVKYGQYEQYIKSWRRLLGGLDNNTPDHDPTQIIGYIYRNIRLNERYDAPTFAQIYYPVVNYFDTVVKKYSENYIELPTYYSQQEELFGTRHMVDIMRHVFTYTMSYDFMTTLKEVMIRMSTAHTREEKNKQDRFVIAAEILDESSVIEYIMGRLPILMIKSVCKISEGDGDPDVKKSSDELLNRVIELLENNKRYSVDRKVLDWIKDKIIPFFRDYMEIFTGEMHRSLTRQLNLFIEQSRLFKMQLMLCG